MPLVRRVPKRGFNNKWALVVAVVNVRDLERVFQDGEEITPVALVEKSLIGGRFDEIKVLGNGTLSKKFTVSAHRFSQSAKEKIEKAGGQVVVLPGKMPVELRKKQAKAASAS